MSNLAKESAVFLYPVPLQSRFKRAPYGVWRSMPELEDKCFLWASRIPTKIIRARIVAATEAGKRGKT